MNKNLLIVVFIGLIIFMFCDVIFTFSSLFKGIFYGASFGIGLIIYFLYGETPKKKSSDNK